MFDLGLSALTAIEGLHAMPAMQQWQSTAPNGYRSHQRGHSIAQMNRHTGKPHEHKREIARNLRRANRVS